MSSFQPKLQNMTNDKQKQSEEIKQLSETESYITVGIIRQGI